LKIESKCNELRNRNRSGIKKKILKIKTLGLPVFRLHVLALSVIATATWLAGWLAG